MILHMITGTPVGKRRNMDRDFEALRGQFPLLARKTYLNSGSYCALANSVRAAFEALSLGSGVNSLARDDSLSTPFGMTGFQRHNVE